MKQRVGIVMLSLAALWLVPAVANAQVTISSVKVTVGNASKTAVYCDVQHVASCGAGAVSVWDLGPSGVTIPAGHTLVLTQTGIIPNTGGLFGNFDTSDRVTQAGTRVCGLVSVGVTETCTVTISINGTQVYTDSSGDPLDFFNADFADNGSTGTNEGHDWVLPPAVDQTGYTIALGYADNEHSCTGAAVCFPSPFLGTATNQFIGSGVVDICTASPNCFDAGALLISAKTASRFDGCTVTQGGWGAPAHGNNPGVFLNNNFATGFPTGATIGSGFPVAGPPFWLHFDAAANVRNFLPQGGPPGALLADGTNPTLRTAAGVFAGQVLALTLNVQLHGFGSLVLSGVGPTFNGKTVNDVLAAADKAISGGGLPAGYTYSSLNDLVDSLNQSFDGCVPSSFGAGHLH